MAPNVLLPQYLLPLAAVSLGRIVLSVEEPLQDYHIPNLDPSPYVTEKVLNQCNGTDGFADQRVFASDLTKILSSWFSKRAKASSYVTSNQIKTVYLNNTGEWLRNAMEPEATRKWAERIQGRDSNA